MVSIKSTFLFLIKLLFAILIFVVPLAFVSNTQELFEFPKMFLVYFIGSTIILIFLVGVILGFFRFKNPPVFFLLFLLIILLSTVSSTHPYTSLWGYYSRFNGGLVSLVVFSLLFLTAYSLFKGRYILFWITGALILNSIPISLLGVMQHFGWLRTPQNRIFSTFGQPNWLAAYLSWGGLVLSNHFLKARQKEARFIFASLFTLIFSALWFTYSLSGLLGFFIGFFFLIFIMARNKDGPGFGLLWLGGIMALVAVLFPGLFFVKVQDAFFDIQRFLSIHVIVFAQSGSYQVSDPGFIRIGLWKSTLKMIFSSWRNFLLGVGPETFPYQFPFFRSNSLNYSSEWEYILNKPHNYYLELAAESGIGALLAFIAFTIKGFVKQHVLTSTLLLSFLVTNFFSWPTVSMELYFWLLLAGAYSYEKTKAN